MIDTVVVPALTFLLLLPVVVRAVRFHGWPAGHEYRMIIVMMGASAIAIRALVTVVVGWIFPGSLPPYSVWFERSLPASVIEVMLFIVLVVVTAMWNIRREWEALRRKPEDSDGHRTPEEKA